MIDPRAEAEGGTGRILTKGAPVVEQDDSPRLPAHSRLEVMAADDVLHEEVQEPFLFRFLESLYLGNEFSVEEEALLSGHRVYSDKRVDGIDWVFANQSPCQAGVVDHLLRRVDGSETVQEGAEGWGEASGIRVQHLVWGI